MPVSYIFSNESAVTVEDLKRRLQVGIRWLNAMGFNVYTEVLRQNVLFRIFTLRDGNRGAEVQFPVSRLDQLWAALGAPPVPSEGVDAESLPRHDLAKSLGTVLAEYREIHRTATDTPMSELDTRKALFKAAFAKRDQAKAIAERLGIAIQFGIPGGHVSDALSPPGEAWTAPDDSDPRMVSLRSKVLDAVRLYYDAKAEAQGLRRSQLWAEYMTAQLKARELAVRLGMGREALDALYAEAVQHAHGKQSEPVNGDSTPSPAAGGEQDQGKARGNAPSVEETLRVRMERVADGLEKMVDLLKDTFRAAESTSHPLPESTGNNRAEMAHFAE